MSKASNPGAVVIDGDGRGDLGVVRALGRCGIPVYLFTDRPFNPVACSRWVSECLPLPPPAAGEEARVEALLAAGRRFRHRPVFFSTGDSSLVLFSRHRERLQPFYRHHLAEPRLIEDLYDKIRFARLSAELGLDVPYSLAPRDLAELERALDRFRFPVVVKPAEKRRWAAVPELVALAAGNVKAVRLETPEALLAFYRAAARYDPAMVVQDYIEGRDESIWELHAYIDRSGEPRGVFTGQKLRTWPIHRGIGCFLRSVWEPEVAELGLRNLRRMGYRGHAAVQLKRLPGGGYRIFEINARYSAWNELHTRAGVNLPLAAYRDSLGLPPQAPPRQREGIRWIDLANDLRALREYRRCGEWSVVGWARSYRGRNCYAVFDWRDPGPTLLPPVRRLWRLGGWPLRRLRRMRRQWAAS